MNIPNTDSPRVVIVGGGFAGITLAKSLQKKKVQTVILDKHNYHTFQPLLYQVSSAGLEPDSIAYPIRKIISKSGIFFRMANVEEVDIQSKRIKTNIGQLSYDYLVLACGAKTNYFGNTEIEHNSMPMKTVPQALNIRSLMLQNFEEAAITATEQDRKALLNFVIVGGGPTGVELAGALAEFKRHVLPEDYHDLRKEDMCINLLEGQKRVLNGFHEKSSHKAEEFLKELGVKVYTGTFVKSYDGLNITTNTDLAIKSKTLIWAAGIIGNPIKGIKSDSLVEKSRRYKVNRYNMVEGYKDVFAVGDIAYMETEKFPHGHPQVAQPAIQQAKLLAKNLMRLINEQSLEKFEYNDKGSMATVGRNKAIVEIGKYTSAGFLAWFVWMFVHLFALVGFRNRIVVFFNWTYNYINFDKAARLIIRPFHKDSKNKRIAE